MSTSSRLSLICPKCNRPLGVGEACPVEHGVPSGVFGVEPTEVERTPRSKRHLLGLTISDKFVITGYLGSGGFGAVYRAEQTALGRDVALKLLMTESVGDPGVIRRFRREARTSAALLDPNVVTLFDFGEASLSEAEEDQALWIAMELVVGPTLKVMLRDEGPPGLSGAVQIGLAILRGLAAAHRQGVVHRDLKPGNVLMDASKQRPYFARLFDFGIASIQGSSGHTTQMAEGGVLGTPKYMAPEQWRARPTSPATDVYAFGFMMAEMLLGEAPIPKMELVRMAAAHCRGPRPRVVRTAQGEAVPPALGAFIERCTAIEAVQRYPSAVEALDALERVAAGLGRSGSGPFVGVPPGAPAPPPAAEVLDGSLGGMVSGSWIGPAGGVGASSGDAPPLGTSAEMIDELLDDLPDDSLQAVFAGSGSLASSGRGSASGSGSGGAAPPRVRSSLDMRPVLPLSRPSMGLAPIRARSSLPGVVGSGRAAPPVGAPIGGRSSLAGRLGGRGSLDRLPPRVERKLPEDSGEIPPPPMDDDTLMVDEPPPGALLRPPTTGPGMGSHPGGSGEGVPPPFGSMASARRPGTGSMGSGRRAGTGSVGGSVGGSAPGRASWSGGPAESGEVLPPLAVLDSRPPEAISAGPSGAYDVGDDYGSDDGYGGGGFEVDALDGVTEIDAPAVVGDDDERREGATEASGPPPMLEAEGGSVPPVDDDVIRSIEHRLELPPLVAPQPPRPDRARRSGPGSWVAGVVLGAGVALLLGWLLWGGEGERGEGVGDRAVVTATQPRARGAAVGVDAGGRDVALPDAAPDAARAARRPRPPARRGGDRQAQRRDRDDLRPDRPARVIEQPATPPPPPAVAPAVAPTPSEQPAAAEADFMRGLDAMNRKAFNNAQRLFTQALAKGLTGAKADEARRHIRQLSSKAQIGDDF